MLAGTRAGVFYHGHLSPWFQVPSSAAQGSPLSHLLYVVAAQPLAARLRQLQTAGVVDSIFLSAPWCRRATSMLMTAPCTLPLSRGLLLRCSTQSCLLVLP
jgi:hypothetical protein